LSKKEDGKMRLKAYSIILLIFLIISSILTIFSYEGRGYSENEIYVDSDHHGYSDGSAEKPYDTIQHAIDVANEGDTIYVFGGFYDEYLIIDKQIKLWGSIEGGNSIIDTRIDRRHTIEINADHVELQDFTISDSRGYKTSPIGSFICIKSNNVVIQGNRLFNTSSIGVYVDSTASGSIISDNLINNTGIGIEVDTSSTSDIINNNVANCSEYAISITSSPNNRLYNNYIRYCNQGINIQNCNDINITANNISTSNYYGISMYQSTGIIKNNSIFNNEGDGIYLGSSYCDIFDNNLSSNMRGIYLAGSNNKIKNNYISTSSGSGIYTISNTNGNLIYLNKFIDNGKSAQENGENQWFYNYQGNYWSDYDNIDKDLDGIGDTPYILAEENIQDNYPLGYFLNPPDKPSNPNPSDSESGVGLKITLKVDINDKDTDKLTVYFYNAKTDELIDIDKRVSNGGIAECKFNLAFNTTFAWYAIANDSLLENKSDPWFFTTKTTPPDNVPPTADAGGPYSGGEGQTIKFDGSGSYDPDGDISFYRWNFGDETSEILAESPDHIYYKSGIYEVTLTVIDNDGTTDTDIKIITIGDYINQKPNAIPGGPYLGNTSELVIFDGSNSYDPDGSIKNYTWDFGDGINGYGAETSHIYNQKGTYLIELVVTDNAGDKDIKSTIITVEETAGGIPGFEFIFMVIAAIIIIFKKMNKS
jgi:parallel beta-helix repeat protein